MKKVLLVDDEQVVLRVVQICLQKLQCAVDAAQTGVAALQYAAEKQYDLIIMDIGLGQTDGFTVTQQIKANCAMNKATPVVALTAHSQDSYRVRAKEIGMQDFFVKPISIMALEKVLSEIVH